MVMKTVYFSDGGREEITEDEWKERVMLRVPENSGLRLYYDDGSPMKAEDRCCDFPSRDFVLLRRWWREERGWFPREYETACLLVHEMERWQIPVPEDWFWSFRQHWLGRLRLHRVGFGFHLMWPLEFDKLLIWPQAWERRPTMLEFGEGSLHGEEIPLPIKHPSRAKGAFIYAAGAEGEWLIVIYLTALRHSIMHWKRMDDQEWHPQSPIQLPFALWQAERWRKGFPHVLMVGESEKPVFHVLRDFDSEDSSPLERMNEVQLSSFAILPPNDFHLASFLWGTEVHQGQHHSWISDSEKVRFYRLEKAEDEGVSPKLLGEWSFAEKLEQWMLREDGAADKIITSRIAVSRKRGDVRFAVLLIQRVRESESGANRSVRYRLALYLRPPHWLASSPQMMIPSWEHEYEPQDHRVHEHTLWVTENHIWIVVRRELDVAVDHVLIVAKNFFESPNTVQLEPGDFLQGCGPSSRLAEGVKLYNLQIINDNLLALDLGQDGFVVVAVDLTRPLFSSEYYHDLMLGGQATKSTEEYVRKHWKQRGGEATISGCPAPEAQAGDKDKDETPP